MRAFAIVTVLALGLATWGVQRKRLFERQHQQSGRTRHRCTSNGIVTINVVAINGAQSFSPNPATLPAGQMVVWHNVNNTTHRVVLNDGSVDTGNLAPGASSQPMAIGAAGGQYHCSIHPEMIGSINQDTAPPSSPTSPY